MQLSEMHRTGNLKKITEISGINISAFKPHFARSAFLTSAGKVCGSLANILKWRNWFKASAWKKF